MNFIYLAYSRSEFGIKRCKIQYFIEHFSLSVESFRGQTQQITENVWDQTAYRAYVTRPQTQRMVCLWFHRSHEFHLKIINSTLLVYQDKFIFCHIWHYQRSSCLWTLAVVNGKFLLWCYFNFIHSTMMTWSHRSVMQLSFREFSC